MPAARCAGYAALLLVLVVATPCSAEEPAAATAETIIPELTQVAPSDDSAEMQEFLADQAFWSTVDHVSHTIDHRPAQQHGHPIIEVAEKDVATATAVAQTAEMQEAQAEQLCLKAKHDVRSRSAQSSKAKRDAAIASLKKFCKHVRNVVTSEVKQDVETITGKKTAKALVEATKRHTRNTAKVEKELFKKTLGDVKVTGAHADKMAKNEATAHALDHMAQKAVLKDKVKADAACAKAQAIAKKAGGKSTASGRKKMAYAAKFCRKMSHVIDHEKALIHKDVVATAAGKSGPGSLEKHIQTSNTQRAVADAKGQADTACEDAMKQAKAVPAANRVQAVTMAKALCAKVKAVVAKRFANIGKPTVTPEVAPAGAASAPAAAAAMQAKADATCERAKTMAAKMSQSADAQHAAVAAAMAKTLCDKVQKMVKKDVKKMSADAAGAPQEAPVVPEAVPEGAQGAIDAVKKTAEEACDHAKNVAAGIKATGNSVQAEAAKTMAVKLCAKVRAAVQKDIEKMSAGAGESPDAVVPESDVKPEDDAAVAPEDDAVASMKAKATAACEHAKNEAKKIAAGGDVMKAAAASQMAAKLCEEVQGVVKKEEQKEREIEGGKPQDEPEDEPEDDSDDEDDSAEPEEEDKEEDKDKDASQETTTVGKVGAMPAKVAKELVKDVAKVRTAEQQNADKAAKLCEAAKRKIRGNSELVSTEQRKASIEIAVRFCKRTEADVKKQKKEDNKTLHQLVKTEASKYGLKVVKMDKSTGLSEKKMPKVSSDTEIAAERKLFVKDLGKDGEHVADKTGLKDAKNEALKNALNKKMAKAKAKVDAHIKEESAEVDTACEKAKQATAVADEVGDRMANLQRALTFCKRAKKVLATEKKQDYAQLDKIEDKVVAENSVDKNGTREGVKDVKDAKSKAESALTDKAAAMCSAMKEKAKALKVPSTMVRKLAVQQAAEFCTKTKKLLAKQAAMDAAAQGSDDHKQLLLQMRTVDAVLAEIGGELNLSEPF